MKRAKTTYMTRLAAGVAALGLLAAAAPASATEVFDLIDQPTLDAFNTEMFGAISDEVGPFTHAFSFTTSGLSSASSSVITVHLLGLADIDFSAIDLDGFAFEQHGFDPEAESWDLNLVSLAAGSHTITVHGDLLSGPASYTGTLNIAAIPEPATWAMMIMGFGGMGAVLRRRNRAAVSSV